MNEWVADLALQAGRGNATGGDIGSPRIGLYRPWGGIMDEGWTRWVMEMYGFELTTVRPSHIKAGNLRERFDVLIFADFGTNTLIEGRRPGSGPGRYTGGIGREGVRIIDTFIREGGTLVTLNGSSNFAIDELHVPVEDVSDGLDNDEFFLSGSILEIEVDPFHPVMAGMPSRPKVMFGNGPIFTVGDDFEGTVFAKFPTEGSPLVSGYLLGEEHLAGYAAGIDVHHGDGHIVMLGFRPQWRAQPFGNFRILFNAALFSGEMAAEAQGSPDFWTAPEEPEEGEDDETEESDGRGGRGGRRGGGR
jgi:hypothetical protein